MSGRNSSCTHTSQHNEKITHIHLRVHSPFGIDLDGRTYDRSTQCYPGCEVEDGPAVVRAYDHSTHLAWWQEGNSCRRDGIAQDCRKSY